MNSTTAPNAGFALPRNAPAAARSTLQLLQRLRHGSLTLQLPDGSLQRFGHGEGIHASLSLHNWNVFGAALKSGDIGFAESYLAGDWHTPNLTDLLRLFIANRRDIEDVIYGSWFGRLAYWIRHKLNRNSKTNSRKNIHAHYDLGNAFYQLWLDGTMNYSSALFETPDQDMVAAQHAKVRRALSMAGAKTGDRVLEIGCGWGALAEMATAEFDASITGVTLSTEQLAFAQQRMERLGTSSRADLRLQDYRDINDGPYDAICSIEMVEAVGREYWPTYFQSVARLLKPGGRACIRRSGFPVEQFSKLIDDGHGAALQKNSSTDAQESGMLGQDLQVQLLPACAAGIDIGGAKERGRILGGRLRRHKCIGPTQARKAIHQQRCIDLQGGIEGQQAGFGQGLLRARSG